jgi:Xaa-Pro aminopeptidase
MQALRWALLTLAPVVLFGQANPWYQTDFPPQEFQARWAKIFDKIGGSAVAVLQGVAQTNGFIMPRQGNDFYYLCGIETPHSYLLLDGRQRKVTLFLPARNVRMESAEGKVLSADDAELVKQLTGVDEVASTEAMRGDFLRATGPRAPTLAIYTPFSPAEGAAQSRGELVGANTAILNDYWDGRLSRESRFVELLRARNPRARVEDLTPILDELRSVKSPREIALIRRASQIAGLGIMEAMRSTKPGLYEYHLDAAARYVFLVNGARLEGYRSIVAAGVPNIWNMHYYRDMSPLRDGDMVLMDFAPEYGYYTSDVTRMWPINGNYSAWQRELLGFVLEYRNAVMKQIRPGVTSAQILEQAKAAMEPVFARWKFSKPIYEKAARELVNRGGGVLSHPVGMTVHDDGAYNRGSLVAGHVFSIDPQLRVPEENLYIRYEDVIVVTESGMENFTAFLPSELDEMEKLVGVGGVVQRVPPVPESAMPGRR